MAAQKRARGRPPKFGEPSAVITVTLPRSTLEALEAIDRDRARAIVKAAAAATAQASAKVEVVEVSPEHGMLVLPHAPALLEIEGLQLIEIAPSRFLIVLSSGVPLSDLELQLQDRIETLKEPDSRDRLVLSQLLRELRASRRSQRLETREVILLQLACTPT